MLQEQYEGAVRYQKRYLDLIQQHHPEDVWGLAVGLNNLGKTYASMGSYHLAEDHLQQALASCRSLDTLPPIKQVPILVNLADVFTLEGLHQRAAACLTDASLRIVTLPSAHPIRGKVYAAWGRLQVSRHAWVDAHDSFRQTLAIQKQTMEHTHPAIARTMASLRNICRQEAMGADEHCHNQSQTAYAGGR